MKYQDGRTFHIDKLFNTCTKGDTLTANLIDMVIGEHIGCGVERTVFEYGLLGDKVVKVESFPRANVLEFEIWQEVVNTPHAKWFAKVHSLSTCGCFLVMDRTTPLEVYEYPLYIPSYMGDTHSGNWGKVGKDVVCHDYANNHIMKKGLNNRMMKAKFR